MRLKSFGCSFIFGSDLKDQKSSWPSLLANDMGWAHFPHANGGIGNLQIAERVLTQLTNTDPSFYVIGWTWIDRFDYTDDQDAWSTITPGDISKQSKYYYRDLHSQYRDKLTSLMYIKLVIDRLQETNTEFIMTYMDDLLFDTTYHTSPGIVQLQQAILPHMTQFEGNSFLDWSRKNGFPISDTLHPLEDAHQAAAKYIKNQFF